ncbi:hypothetical protein U8335_13690 [Roseiconus lacunae]|uniref:hypothetical protein n=1 Tax=Roseiconus lacunae TaxID=2605694 RepID=UPI0030857F41|nr:hypothetical protein U8335_13690 [Stieleria sp. HD01]
MMRRIVDVGLPPHPPLHFDTTTRTAVVTTRLADWRAVERGNQLTSLMMKPLWLATGFLIWGRTPSDFHWIGRIVIVVIVTSIILAMLKPILFGTLPMFFARILFARRLRVTMRPEAIGFRSWLYGRGVRITRQFQNRPVQIRFTVRQDREASTHSVFRRGGQRTCRQHLEQAAVLEAVVEAGWSRVQDMEKRSGQRMRAIPVATVDAKTGERLAVVLNAAVELTHGGNKQSNSRSVVVGRDLDQPSHAR